MNSDYLRRLDITVDTDDPLDLSLAIASRGVLQAAAQSADLLALPRRWEDAIAKAVRPGELTPWHLPAAESAGEFGHLAPLSAAKLASAWRNVVIGPQVSARIALEPMQGWTWPRWFPFSGSVANKFANEQASPWGNTRMGIASVVMTTDMPGKADLGQWPMRIGIFPSELAHEMAVTLSAASMVRRDLAKVSILSPSNAECDLLIAPFALREFRQRVQSYGFVPAASVVVARSEGLQNQAQRANTVKYLNAQVGASVVASGIPFGGLEGRWLNEVVRSLSHRDSFDVAMWQADGAIRKVVGPNAARKLGAPTIIADAGFLTDSTLDRHVLKLADRVELLKQPLHFDALTASRLRLEPGTHPSSDVARSLRDNVASMSFIREDDAASGVSELSQTVSAAEAAIGASVEDANTTGGPPLFADVTFIDPYTRRRIDDSVEALQIDRAYDFEVALRRVRTGISHRGEPYRAVAEPPTIEGVSLLVVVSARDVDFDLPETVICIVLSVEVTAESDHATFQVTPRRVTPHASDLVSLEVRIYYELNLLEFLDVRAEVVSSRQSSLPQLGMPVPIFVEQCSRVGRLQSDLIVGLHPRHMGIDLRRVGDNVRFTFSVHTREADPVRSVVMSGRSEISLAALVIELNRLRRAWEDIVVERIGNALEVAKPSFQPILQQLASAGSSLWNMLFRGQQGGSLWTIGEWLQKHKLADGSQIDVQLLDSGKAFLFPWSMLYDIPFASESMVDPNGFWGLRYSIAQRAPAWTRESERALTSTGGSRIEFMIWDSFPNTFDQIALFAALSDASQGRLNVTSPPIDSQKDFYRMMEKCDAEILYFYAHGYTRPVEADSGYSVVKRIKEIFESLPIEGQARIDLRPLYDLVSAPDFDPDESWIGLSNGRLFLRDLRAKTVNLVRSPIVFLNMCQSAQVMPGLTDSFVSFFLERNARSVLGTECPITPAFAHPFSERLLREFMAGQTLGEALRRTRCHFMTQMNPLGLAYSLFGTATVKYDPAIVPEQLLPTT